MGLSASCKDWQPASTGMNANRHVKIKDFMIVLNILLSVNHAKFKKDAYH